MTHKQQDVEFPEVPTMEGAGLLDPEMQALLSQHHTHVYEQYHRSLKSWQSYLRAERKFLRSVNRAIWDVPGNSAKHINGFAYGNAAVFFEKMYDRKPKRRSADEPLDPRPPRHCPDC